MAENWAGTPASWTNGPLTAAALNTELRDRMEWIKAALLLHGIDSASARSQLAGKLCGVRAKHMAAQDVIAGQNTFLTFSETDAWDSDGFHSTSSSTERITIPAGLGGYYQIGIRFRCPMGSNANNLVRTIIAKGNTSPVSAPSVDLPDFQWIDYGRADVPLSVYVDHDDYALLAPGEFLTAQIQINSVGAALGVTHASFTAMRLFAA